MVFHVTGYRSKRAPLSVIKFHQVWLHQKKIASPILSVPQYKFENVQPSVDQCREDVNFIKFLFAYL